MSANSNLVRVHTTIDGAMAGLKVGERVVSKKWNKTTVQNAMERHAVIPMECVTVAASEVSESFKALVESALYSAAVSVLTREIKERGENCFELPAECFARPMLVEAFLGGDTWLEKETLEKLFTASATWQRMASRPEYASNSLYKARVAKYKDNILKLAAKNVSFTVETCDAMLAAIDEKDMDTEYGVFVIKRLDTLRKKAENDVVDLAGL